jgi:hypothetical protein
MLSSPRSLNTRVRIKSQHLVFVSKLTAVTLKSVDMVRTRIYETQDYLDWISEKFTLLRKENLDRLWIPSKGSNSEFYEPS